MEDSSQLGSPDAAASAVVDTLRQLLSTLGALVASPAGNRAAEDSTQSRSLPALAKALKRLWFNTPLGEAWDSKEQALWLCHLITVIEGSRAGLLSFYGAGLLVCGALRLFAEVALEEAGLELDQVWEIGIEAVQEVLRGPHWEWLQQLQADHRCGGGSDPLLSSDRLPLRMKRTLDLEGIKLSRAQAAGLGAAMLLPGVMTVGLGGIGCALLVKSARDFTKTGGSAGGTKGDSKWQNLQSKCLEHAHDLLRRKACPLEVHYEGRSAGPQTVRVCLYHLDDPLCAVPVGGLASSSTGGESSAVLAAGERCVLRPLGQADSFRLRVYRPGTLLDQVLHDGVETRRGDRLRIEPSCGGKAVRVYAQARRSQSEAAAATSTSGMPAHPASEKPGAPEEAAVLEAPPEATPEPTLEACEEASPPKRSGKSEVATE